SKNSKTGNFRRRRLTLRLLIAWIRSLVFRTAAQSRNFHISTSGKNPPKPGISARGNLCSSF
ncbi:hypothetical protein HMPREF9104_00228, partial [Lentilactobacillus kisonensis F0435]